MKVAIVAPVWFPVPPTGYGGIEWVVWLLAEGLVEAGHDVTLFASGESRTKAKLRTYSPRRRATTSGARSPSSTTCCTAMRARTSST